MKTKNTLKTAFVVMAATAMCSPSYADDDDGGIIGGIKGIAEDAVKIIEAGGKVAGTVSAIADQVAEGNSTVGLAINTALVSAEQAEIKEESQVVVGQLTIDSAVVGAVSNGTSVTMDDADIVKGAKLHVGNVEVNGSTLATGIFTSVLEARGLKLNDSLLSVGNVSIK